MQLRIKHSTRYDFDAPAPYGVQQLRKTPKSEVNQKVLSWGTTVIGGQKELQFEDFHHNIVELISFDQNTESIELISEGVVEIEDQNGVIGPHRGPVPLALFQRPTVRTKAGKGVRQLLREVPSGAALDQLHALSTVIKSKITYETDVSQPDWTAEDAITAGRGVCQDHSHVFIACARALGVPARYVSGYLMMDDRAQQEATHAWAEAHVDGLGWVGFDVSNGISPDGRYVRVATGLDYGEAAPVRGNRTGAAGEALKVQLEVAQQ
ncbi:MAG: transglutaminase family protein [Epibacterium sp.]|jgi:transglutaminase-like putative cysteine protease|nr:transglutaminase family protein [Epibacterium sp.]NQX74486.1 transglutaminase family protein [Epibacterium sp.]